MPGRPPGPGCGLKVYRQCTFCQIDLPLSTLSPSYWAGWHRRGKGTPSSRAVHCTWQVQALCRSNKIHSPCNYTQAFGQGCLEWPGQQARHQVGYLCCLLSGMRTAAPHSSPARPRALGDMLPAGHASHQTAPQLDREPALSSEPRLPPTPPPGLDRPAQGDRGGGGRRYQPPTAGPARGSRLSPVESPCFPSGPAAVSSGAGVRRSGQAIRAVAM